MNNDHIVYEVSINTPNIIEWLTENNIEYTRKDWETIQITCSDEQMDSYDIWLRNIKINEVLTYNLS